MIKRCTLQILTFLLCSAIADSVFAQGSSITGTVIDDKSVAVPYANVVLQGTQYGATTDEDGNYQIVDVPTGSYTLLVTYIGYSDYTQEVNMGTSALTINITLRSDYIGLDEVVVVGYGTRQTKDLTGSITSLSTKDFNTGTISTPEQLIMGKVAGVQITSNGGAPGSGSRIRIRGGTSLNASNDPLIVIDGVPVDNNGISGSANALNLINPNDIENITILKDASAAAIYGSRAANGVIIITTKKGMTGGGFGVQFSTNNSVSQIVDYTQVLSAEEFTNLVNEIGTDQQKELLGTADTDWQKEIYRTAFTTDNNLVFGGGHKWVPYRISLGYLNESGILERSQLQRTSVAINFSPTFLKDHLKVDLNSKVSYTNNFFADQNAIGAAVTFDPTQPVFSDTSAFGGYFEWLDPATRKPNVLAPKNPVGLLYQKEDVSEVFRYLQNIQLDYKFHFLPELRANLNLGMDRSRSAGTIYIPDTAASSYYQGGVNNQYQQEKDNKLLEFYLNYAYNFASSKIDLTGGYSYQDWLTFSPAYPNLSAAGDTITPAGNPTKTQNTLISFYGRINYTLLEKYLFTFTLRDDGSSRFSPDTRWGLFPSAAFAWRISDEEFMKNATFISNLKLRLGYGITGQQDIFSDYPYIANYNIGESTAQYQFGDKFYYVLRPDGYDANIKWEETETFNIGLDFGFVNGRINGSLDFYRKNTYDLLAVIPVPAGTNFTNQILTNVGDMRNSGVEGTFNFVPVDNKDLRIDFGVNVTYNQNEVLNLTKVPDSTNLGILVGGIDGGIGNTIQIHAVGYPTFSYYVYEQLYDEDGNPVIPVGNAATDTAAFKDRNGDGKITPDDRYIAETKAEPDVYLGFYANLGYRNFSAGFSMRGSFGNYVYNNVNSTHGTYAYVDGSKNYNNNLVQNYFDTEFQKNLDYQFQSDYYVEDASFVRMDNFYLGYTFRNITDNDYAITLSGIVQNVFLITDYSGIDPEVVGGIGKDVVAGIDKNIYPRPRIYSINLKLNL